MRLAFMGSPDFAVPALRALHDAGHQIAAVYCQPPRPAGRGQAVRAARCTSRGCAGPAGAHAGAAAPGPCRAAGIRGSGAGCGGGRRLRPDPAAGDAGGAEARLPQHPRQPAAALARRRADPRRGAGRRQRNRHHHHADGRRPGHRPDAAARGGADRAEPTPRAALHDVLAALGAHADPAGTGRSAGPRCRSRRKALPTRRSWLARTAGSTGAAMPQRSNARSAPSIPGRGPSPRWTARS